MEKWYLQRKINLFFEVDLEGSREQWGRLLDPSAPCTSAMGHLWSPSNITMKNNLSANAALILSFIQTICPWGLLSGETALAKPGSC